MCLWELLTNFDTVSVLFATYETITSISNILKYEAKKSITSQVIIEGKTPIDNILSNQ